MALTLDKAAFFRRAKRFYESWKDSDSDLHQVDAVVNALGVDEDVVYSKTATLQIWLLGYELTDTIMVFTDSHIYILASKKKIDFLKPLEGKENEKDVPPVVLLARNKSDKDSENFKKLVDAIGDSKSGRKVGGFPKDDYKNEFISDWKKSFQTKEFDIVDITPAVAIVVAPKEDSEVDTMKKSSQLTVDVFSKFLKEELTQIIDSDKKVKHSKLATQAEAAVTDRKYIKNVDTKLVEVCYSPIIQSGGKYSLKFSAVADKNVIHFGSIICYLGIRYKQYCSNIVRTILVNPTESMKKNYDFLVELHEHVVSLMKPGATLASVFKKGMEFVKQHQPNLEDKVTKNFGFATGIEFREASMVIGPKTEVKITPGMVFNVAIGLNDLRNGEATDPEGKVYALFVADTVLMGKDGSPELLTINKKKLKNIAIIIQEEDEEEEDDGKTNGDSDHVKKSSSQKNDKSKNVADILSEENLGRGKRGAVLTDKLRSDASNDDKRKKHQRELAQQVNEKARERLARGNQGPKKEVVKKSNVSYKSLGHMPKEKEIKELKIFVDKKYETVILPIFGVPCPFHISTIKNISSSIEGDFTYLRVNFFHPGSTMGKENSGLPDSSFLKEITFRASNLKEPGELNTPSSNLNVSFRLIKEVQKKYKTREAEEKEKEGIVKQDTLQLSMNKGNPKLKDLFIRPSLVNKRIVGTLESHINGFRFTSMRGDKVDILYNNIKHAFYQPCDGEMVILLHFHLKNAIMFGKKKNYDVQVYTEVGEITTDLNKHHNMADRDDLAQEQAERELRNKLKTAFKQFCEKTEAMCKSKIDFEVPWRDISFPGVPYRSIALLQPTPSALINLTEWPPFTISMDEVELVHFERVQFHLKNFDMIFVFKDYTKKVAMIAAIPMSSLDQVKAWLDDQDIRYTEGVQSLNWTKIMKTIVDDPEGFFDQGGWSFLDQESDGEPDDDDEDEEDEVYNPQGAGKGGGDGSDEGSEFGSDASESDDYSVDEESSGSEEELSSGEESGKDWSELEDEAREHDNNRDYDDDTPAPNNKKKMHPLPKKTHSSHSSSYHNSSSNSEKRKKDSSGGGKDRKKFRR